MSKLVSAFALLAAPAAVLAHPGHGIDGGSVSLLHYLTEPMHGIGLMVLVAAASLVALYRRAPR